MVARIGACVSLAMLWWASAAAADELVWRPSQPTVPTVAPVGLARPQPIIDGASPAPAPPRPTLVFRAQAPDPLVPPPPPPPFPGGAAIPSPVPGVPVAPYNGADPYKCGEVNSNADLGFWSRCGQRLKHCFGDTSGAVGGMFQTGQGRNPFQSDHCFDEFASPVSNPFYFEDPRALTELKVLGIWQRTPNGNAYWAGGDNFFGGFQGRLAFTPWLSLVVNKLGWTWIEPHNGAPVGIAAHSGFSEIQIGPKVTFLREPNCGTVAAFGLTFEIPVGSAQVLQDTGTLSLRPYFSFAQSFGKSNYGTFNFMNTTGYDFGVDNARNDFFFSSFHLDYNVANRNVFYPLVELNWIYYTQNGHARDFGFGGGDLFNFGSNGTAGHDELTLALGFRFKPFTEAIQFGLTGQFNVLPNSNGRHLDAFRLTADVIFRY
jgi:hypothetical protein